MLDQEKKARLSAWLRSVVPSEGLPNPVSRNTNHAREIFTGYGSLTKLRQLLRHCGGTEQSTSADHINWEPRQLQANVTGHEIRKGKKMHRKIARNLRVPQACVNDAPSATSCDDIHPDLLSHSGLYKSPSSNLWSVKSSVDHWHAGITGPAGQWNKKLRLNPAIHCH